MMIVLFPYPIRKYLQKVQHREKPKGKPKERLKERLKENTREDMKPSGRSLIDCVFCGRRIF